MNYPFVYVRACKAEIFSSVSVLLNRLAEFASYVLYDLKSGYPCAIFWDWVEGAGGKKRGGHQSYSRTHTHDNLSTVY